MGVPAPGHAMDQLRQVAALLQRHVKPKRGRTPYVDYVVAAILLCRVPNLSTRFACLPVGADPVRGHGRVGKYAAVLRRKLATVSRTQLAFLDAACMAITAEASANIAGFDRMKRAIFPPAQLANADCAPLPAAASAITAAPTATSPAQPKEVSVFVTNDRHAAMRPLAGGCARGCAGHVVSRVSPDRFAGPPRGH